MRCMTASNMARSADCAALRCWRRAGSKMGDQRTEELCDRKYRSYAEAAYPDKLFMAKRADAITSHEPQYRVDLVGVDGQLPASPRAGRQLGRFCVFRVNELDGSRTLVGVKGPWTQHAELKAPLVAAMYRGRHSVESASDSETNPLPTGLVK